MKLFISLCFASLAAFAANNDVTHRPKSFNYQQNKAVFVDFQEATYNITYDIDAKKASVKALLKMNVVEEGHPVFDLYKDPTLVKIDGIEVHAPLITTPSQETKVRVISKKLPKGSYDLEVQVPLESLVEYTSTGVKSAFWVTDLEDRYYLERYIPVNLEYDRIKMIFNLQFKGLKDKQHIFANGDVKWLSEEKARIEFPDYFTVNSLYFHTTPVGSLELLETQYKSIDGRDIPVVIYTAKNSSAAKTLKRYKALTEQTLKELEGDYGAFPHSSVTIYNASLAHMGLGGMEYAGATVTNLSALEHELFHSYFARGVSPANGNAGWIDESLASWRDNGYNRLVNLFGSSSMASHPYYTRKTDTAAYGFGARFMAYLDNKFADKGGLKPFMNKLLEKKIFEPIFTEDFIKEMETFYGEKLDSVFKTYVFGKSGQKGLPVKPHPIHRKMNPSQMKSIL